ncbi:MAG TPA: hypothetical protein VK338_01555 [Candidatus Nitrosocosmicus sp.]|nr:hypothetical protein [Candidatus Nitrosocosmicus sp.]
MSLTDASYYFRKILPYTVFGLIFVVILYFFIKVFLAYLDAKPKPLVFNPTWGILSKPQITDPADTSKQPIEFPDAEFILDTIEGQPITATDTAKVYFLPESPTRLGYVQNAYLIAKTFGFSPDIKYQLQGQNLTFEDDKRKLSIDVSNFNYSFEYKFATQPELFENTSIPDEIRIKEKAKTFLRTLGRYPEELARGKEQVSLFNYNKDTQEFTKVDNVDDANAVEVDFFRPDIDGFSILTSKYLFSQNYIVMVFHEDEPTIVKAQIKFFEKEEQTVGTYPVKTGDQAFEDLKNKKGLIVSPGSNQGAIMIKKMGMGYFDPDFYQQYLQPVYYFIGENGFVAYVPAVVDQYISTESAELAP